jgi:hypothetical protein
VQIKAVVVTIISGAFLDKNVLTGEAIGFIPGGDGDVSGDVQGIIIGYLDSVVGSAVGFKSQGFTEFAVIGPSRTGGIT